MPQDTDVLVIGGAGVDTVVRVPALPLPYADSYMIRPGIEAWAKGRTKVEACNLLGDAGIAAGPCFTPEDVVHDPHLHARNMLSEMARPDGGEPVLTPGNPVKLSDVPELPDQRVPWLGEHTDTVLRAELGLSDDDLARLRAAGTIS